MRTTNHEISLPEPFRLDLTVSALRRVATNPVDMFTASAEYLRALRIGEDFAIVRARQPGHDRLQVDVISDSPDHARFVAVVERMLGLRRSIAPFREASRDVPWLADLVEQFSGLRPPCYPSIWEAFVNSVAFQQVSLHSASAVTRRLVRALGDPIAVEGRQVYVFPDATRFQQSPDEPLRAAGLSGNKLRTLREVADRVLSGAVSADALDRLPSDEAARELQAIPGIGPWTAAVILLRGLGRLDVFPPNDSGVAANLRRLADPSQTPTALAERLGPQRGMLYFYLLISRLAEQGRVGEPSVEVERLER